MPTHRPMPPSDQIRHGHWLRRVRHAVVSIAGSLLLSIAAALPATAEWADWIVEGDLTFEYDSNLNNASASSEREYDLSWIPELRLGRSFQVADNTRIRMAAEVRGDIHHRWTGLNAGFGGGHISLFHKFGLGDAPWAQAFFTGGFEGVKDDERSGSRIEVGARLGKRFTPRFDAALAYKFTTRDGDKGSLGMGMGMPGPGPMPMMMTTTRTDVWDQNYHDIRIEGSFLVTEQLLATVGYEFRHGDLYSNAKGDDVAKVLANADVKALALDNVFGGWAYRLRGNAHTPFVRLNYGFGNHWSIDTGYRFRYASSRSLNYKNHITELAVLYRY